MAENSYISQSKQRMWMLILWNVSA